MKANGRFSHYVLNLRSSRAVSLELDALVQSQLLL